MWSTFLRLLADARRPLVVLDFETAGLGGAPPVEFAVLVFAPWDSPDDGEETRAAARLCPPGLTYAVSRRLDPLQPIDPDATRVHGIGDADVRGKATAYTDLEIRGFFQGLAAGDATWPAPGSAGPAVLAGHNLAGADVPWATRWGYLPDADLDLVDTMRLARRLAKEHPYPLSVDLLPSPGDGTGGPNLRFPAIDLGLDAFSSSLTGVHAALYGQRPDGAHGALADACATARVLARLLDAWDLALPPLRSDVPATANLAALLAGLDAPPPGEFSWDGWLRPAPAGGYVWAKGKFKGKPAHRDQYVLDRPRRPTGLDGLDGWWCSQHTADILAGLRPMAAAR